MKYRNWLTAYNVFVMVSLVVKLEAAGYAYVFSPDLSAARRRRSDSEPRIQHLHFSNYNKFGYGSKG